MTRRAQPPEPAEGRLTAAELADYLVRYVRPDAEVRIRHGGQLDPATGLVADFHVAILQASEMPHPDDPPQVVILVEGERVNRPG